MYVVHHKKLLDSLQTWIVGHCCMHICPPSTFLKSSWFAWPACNNHCLNQGWRTYLLPRAAWIVYYC